MHLSEETVGGITSLQLLLARKEYNHYVFVSVYNSANTKLLTYHYDAWGNVTSQWHTCYGSDYYASHNPFKYRGYYHDAETGFYYLNSRYYDPATGRFINADGLISTGTGMIGYNMFAYCNNNPVMFVDSFGELPVLFFVIGVGIGLLIGIAVSADIQFTEELERKAATEKYNKDTVNVYFEGDGNADPNKVNVRFYKTATYVNIEIDKSLEIDSKYEMEAILNVITQSEYYDKNKYGSIDFMCAQWVAHNMTYKIASNSTIGYKVTQFLSGSKDPIESGSTLDLRSKDNMSRKQRLIYDIIYIFY